MSLLTHKQHVETLTWEPWGGHIIARGRRFNYAILDAGMSGERGRARYPYQLHKIEKHRPFSSHDRFTKIGNYKAVWEAQYAAERFENEPKSSVRATRGPRRSAAERLFIGVYPGGISYADRSREKHGDYARCGFLSYDTLELKVEPDCPRDLRPLIEKDAARMRARRGQPFEISSSGQTVMLGGAARSSRGFRRIGVAFTKPRGPSKRRDEYGVYEGEHGGRYVKYDGYREQTPSGERMVGLPLVGPMASHAQPLTEFKESHFEEVRIFEGSRATREHTSMRPFRKPAQRMLSHLKVERVASERDGWRVEFSDDTSIHVHRGHGRSDRWYAMRPVDMRHEGRSPGPDTRRAMQFVALALVMPGRITGPAEFFVDKDGDVLAEAM